VKQCSLDPDHAEDPPHDPHLFFIYLEAVPLGVELEAVLRALSCQDPALGHRRRRLAQVALYSFGYLPARCHTLTYLVARYFGVLN
jgi:hypothetical protein